MGNTESKVLTPCPIPLPCRLTLYRGYDCADSTVQKSILWSLFRERVPHSLQILQLCLITLQNLYEGVENYGYWFQKSILEDWANKTRSPAPGGFVFTPWRTPTNSSQRWISVVRCCRLGIECHWISKAHCLFMLEPCLILIWLHK